MRAGASGRSATVGWRAAAVAGGGVTGSDKGALTKGVVSGRGPTVPVSRPGPRSNGGGGSVTAERDAAPEPRVRLSPPGARNCTWNGSWLAGSGTRARSYTPALACSTVVRAKVAVWPSVESVAGVDAAHE